MEAQKAHLWKAAVAAIRPGAPAAGATAAAAAAGAASPRTAAQAMIIRCALREDAVNRMPASVVGGYYSPVVSHRPVRRSIEGVTPGLSGRNLGRTENHGDRTSSTGAAVPVRKE